MIRSSASGASRAPGSALASGATMAESEAFPSDRPNVAGHFPPEAESEFLTAREAADLLGVKLPTVYAYTSRGLIQSVPGGKGRSRRYRRRDLERLCARRDARAGHGPVAAAALRQGEPVMDSSITLISIEQGPIYRGRAALALAEEGRSLEWVAEGLWSGDWRERPIPEGWRPEALGVDLEALIRVLPPRVEPLSVMSFVIPLLASHDRGRFSWHPEAVLARARFLLRRSAAILALGREGQDPIASVEASLAAPSVAAAIGAAFALDLDDAEISLLDQALVLAADHELNASTFAARVAASTGTDLYGCLSAALAALSGPRHGGAADRVDALLGEAGPASQVQQVVHDRQRRGEVIEGFAHPIYAPHADPRGTRLVELACALAGDRPEVQSVVALVDAMQRGGFGGPSIDVGLVGVSRALGLPAGTATALFALGRMVGWVAHALEQYQAGFLVRPRARYREEPGVAAHVSARPDGDGRGSRGMA